MIWRELFQIILSCKYINLFNPIPGNIAALFTSNLPHLPLYPLLIETGLSGKKWITGAQYQELLSKFQNKFYYKIPH